MRENFGLVRKRSWEICAVKDPACDGGVETSVSYLGEELSRELDICDGGR